MIKKRAIILGFLALVILGGVFATIYKGMFTDKVMDISGDGIAGFKACPVHKLPFSSEQVSAWHGDFSPHSTKEWWKQVSVAKLEYPCAQPFPPQVDNPRIDVVIRPYCGKCRDGFNAFVSQSKGESDPRD